MSDRARDHDAGGCASLPASPSNSMARGDSQDAAQTTPELCRRCGRMALPNKLITITVEEYHSLLRAGDGAKPAIPNFRAVSRSRIARDPELARFVLDAAATKFSGEIEENAVAAFGRARVPSRSAIYRFIRAVEGQD